MAVNTDVIRACLLYEYKLGTNAAEACRKICMAFGDDAVTKRTAQRWHRKFRSGDETLEDAPRSGAPTVLNDDELKRAIEEDSAQTCQELAQQFHVSDETIRAHLHNLGKVWKLSKWLPHELTDCNKLQRLSICSSLLSRLKNEPFLDHLLTCDEKWIQYSSNKRSHHWLARTDPLPGTAKPPLHSKKLLLCVWWTSAGIVHHEFLPRGQTINASVYTQQLDRVQDALRRKQPALVNRSKVRFLQDNARPHTAQATLNAITALEWDLLPHPPYSPDISPSDYHLFRALDNEMRTRRFRDDAEIKTAVAQFFCF